MKNNRKIMNLNKYHKLEELLRPISMWENKCKIKKKVAL